MRRAALTALAFAALAAPAHASPIPGSPLPTSAPSYVGSPATPHGVYVPKPPQHPFMARNPFNNIHNDAYMTDTYRGPGPLGRQMSVTSTSQIAECATLTFDSHGRIESVCVGVLGPTLKLFDARTLNQLASYSLPPRQVNADVVNALTDFSGGGYFYLDNRDRAVIPTTTKHVLVIRQTEGPGFQIERDYDLSGLIPSDDKIVSNIPDWEGRIWVVTKGGVIVAIDPRDGGTGVRDLHETIANSLAVDNDGGVYIVTTKALYRMDAAPDGRPTVSWREVYDNVGVAKPGQVSAGSGTTPTLMGDRWVSITDNADPMNVVVYRRERALTGAPRKVCQVPVFGKGASDTENSLTGAGRAMVVTNNYGYRIAAAINGGLTTPGIERVDIDRDGRGCHKVWANHVERSPSAVPKLSLATGLIYTVTKDPAGSSDVWYLAALDFRTGRTVFKQLYGTSFSYNVNYAPVSIGPDGSAYTGVLGGLVRIADATPPVASVPKPRLALRVRIDRRGRVFALLTGADVEWVLRQRTRIARLAGGRVRVTVKARMVDGALYTLRRTVRR